MLWIILETSLHSFFELGMFGLPILQWIFARRKDLAPRKRSAVSGFHFTAVLAPASDQPLRHTGHEPAVLLGEHLLHPGKIRVDGLTSDML